MQLISFYPDTEQPVKASKASVLQKPFSEAADYRFGGEPAIVNLVYVAHPRDEARLVPYGQYDNLTMKDKFNEALRIVQVLGAHRVVTRTFSGNNTKLKLKAGLTAGAGGAEFGHEDREEIQFEQVGTGGAAGDPGPSAYPDEPGFDAATRAVLLNGARKVTIMIESQSAFRLDSDIASRLRKAGFSLGASAEKSKIRTLQLEAHFPEKGKLASPDEEALRPLTEPRPPMDPDSEPSQKPRWRRHAQ